MESYAADFLLINFTKSGSNCYSCFIVFQLMAMGTCAIVNGYTNFISDSFSLFHD